MRSSTWFRRLNHIRTAVLLNIVIGAVFVVATIIAVVYVNAQMRQRALEEAELKAMILLDRNLATHTYFSHDLKPSLFELTESILPEGYFDPTWMSSTYAVRAIDEYFKALSTTDYYYKEAAINARSPENEADAYERDFIQELDQDPEVVERSSVRVLDDQPYFVTLRRGEAMEEACLRCHSTPDLAPAGMVEVYGRERSFHREVKELISAISIRVPLSAPYATVNRFSWSLLAVGLPLLALLFVAQSWISRQLLLNPLKRMHTAAQRISAGDKHLGEEIPLPFGRELRELTAAFNAMSVKLRRVQDRLEESVRERTSQLESTNERLRQEITDRIRSEAALRESEKRYRDLVENMNEVIYTVDQNGVIAYISPSIQSFLGYSPSEAIGQPISSFIYQEDLPRLTEAVQNLLTGRDEANEYRAVTKSGEIRWIRTSSRPMLEKGRPIGIQGVLTDITERQRATEALTESERRYRLLADNISDVVWVTDLELNLTYVSPSVERLRGYTAEEVIGQGFEEGLTPESFQVVMAAFSEAQTRVEGNGTDTHQVQSIEAEYIHRDGSTVWTEIRATFLYDSDGQPYALMGVTRDISERRWAEGALRESEQRYRSLVEQSLQAIMVVQDVPPRIVFANQTCSEITGYSIDELSTLSPERALALVHPEDQPDLVGRLADHLSGEPVPATGEFRVVARDGTVRWVEYYASLVEHAGRPAVQSAFADITDRKQAEQQIQASLREKEIMLQEIHHRVKNNLQIISSLLDLQSTSIQDPRIVQALQNSQARIRSMALVHERLYRSPDLTRIDAAVYVRSLASYLFMAYANDIGDVVPNVQIDDISLAIDTAIPCGLIINELISNGLKYAFPPDRDWPQGERGEIRIEMRQAESELGQQIHILVSDNGVGLPPDLDWQNPSSLGLQLVHMLTQQLDGILELDQSSGTSFRLSFPQ